jgi:hypothetical protein
MSGEQDPWRDRHEPWMWRELRRPITGPDLTGPVMRRLGLGGLTARQANRRRALRGAARFLLCVAVVGGSSLLVRAWTVFSRTPPEPGPTIPSAIRHDLEHHGRTIDGAIRTIQGLSAVQAARSESQVPPPEVDSPQEQEPVQPRV